MLPSYIPWLYEKKNKKETVVQIPLYIEEYAPNKKQEEDTKIVTIELF